MDGPKSTAKLRFFRDMESKMQTKWQTEKTYEVDAPNGHKKSNDEKFLGTFPFPYPNGRIHIGHTFSLSKLEVCVCHPN
jgi:leucyl-tRNA synthetase